MIIEKCQFTDIKHFSAAAKKERSVLSNGMDHQWFMARVEDQVVGCSCAALIGVSQGRIKGTFVLPGYRGRGISKALNDACLAHLERNPSISHVTAFVTMERNLAWYKKAGFTILKENNGIAFVRKLV